MFYCRNSYDWGEVMNSFDSMKTKLESTGLYKVTAKSNIRAELLAYAEGLNTEFDMLETMERELFIDTAENCGITERERFVGKINADYPLEKRREMLKISEQKVGGKCTPDDFNRIVRGYGVENFTISEAPTRNRVDIKISDTKTDAEKKLIEKRVNADFPLHLNAIISYVNA